MRFMTPSVSKPAERQRRSRGETLVAWSAHALMGLALGMVWIVHESRDGSGVQYAGLLLAPLMAALAAFGYLGLLPLRRWASMLLPAGIMIAGYVTGRHLHTRHWDAHLLCFVDVAAVVFAILVVVAEVKWLRPR